MRRRAASLKKRLTDRDTQMDILTAALVGAAVGVTATMLLRPQRRRIFDRDLALKTARRGFSAARKKGEDLLDAMPDGDEIGERVREYAEAARDTIDRAVEGELRALRKRLRRERSRI